MGGLNQNLDNLVFLDNSKKKSLSLVINNETLKNSRKVSDLIDGLVINPEILSSIKSLWDGTYEMPVNKTYLGFEELPYWYWIKWGWARLLLELNLWLVSNGQPRDIDLVRYIEDELDDGMDDELAKKFMPDDFAHWDWVEPLEENYFESRDLTINEVLYKEGKLNFTKQCLSDTLNHTIRPTDYEFNEEYKDYPFKILIKALRFYVNTKEKFWDAELVLREPRQLYDFYNNMFRLALNLDRSYWVSEKSANKLMEALKDIWKLPEDISSIEEARTYMEDSGNLKKFDFKNIPSELENFENLMVFIDDIDREYIDWNSDLENMMNLPSRESAKVRNKKYRLSNEK